MNTNKKSHPMRPGLSKKDLIEWIRSTGKTTTEEFEKTILPVSLDELVEMIELLSLDGPAKAIVLDDAEKARLVLETYSQSEISQQTGIPFSTVNQLANHSRELTNSRWETIHKLALMHDSTQNNRESISKILEELTDNELAAIERMLAKVKEKSDEKLES